MEPGYDTGENKNISSSGANAEVFTEDRLHC